jgi:hypothetical protein
MWRAVVRLQFQAMTGREGRGMADEISAKEAAEILGVGVTTVHEYRRCRDLEAVNKAPSSRRRGRWVFSRRDVLALKERQRERAARHRS